jgi:DNA helicase-2/ATP-dependent DNA helicase PcrA
LNPEQLKAIAHVNGPLLVIAGPGSGKTLVLVLRALNLLLHGFARPEELLLCTFTEKAAFELRDRLTNAAERVGYTGDLTRLLVGTIHGISNDFVNHYRHHTHLGNGYRVLDDLTQLLFLHEHFDEVVGPEENGKYLGRWTTRWTAIEGLRGYLNKVTEEVIDPAALSSSPDSFLARIGRACAAYDAALEEGNCIDFAHQQTLFARLLDDPVIGEKIVTGIKYVMVDEFQDTNYIQEQLLLRLAQPDRNLCVVGDEDQSLYRFRGATVRNILEFEQTMPGCEVVKLTTNYRSHRAIVDRYNAYMHGCDWRNPTGGPAFRYDKTIQPDPTGTYPDYPAVFAIWGETERDEAGRFAELVAFLKTEGVIEDYSQVALLLRSVRLERSGHYLRALEERGIPAYCPRARGYFENEEIRLIVACFALLLGYHGDGRGEVRGSLRELADYVDESLVLLARTYAHSAQDLTGLLRRLVDEIERLEETQTLDRRLADYFYRFVACEPFAAMLANENRARNLAIFSQLLIVFQNYYHYSVISHRNREPLRHHFFNSFLRLLHDGGINEYEDPDEPFPKGHVQVMTIHQSKGLEFPVVVVGSLAQQISAPKELDARLAPYMHRPPFEPAARITEFDRMRLHYVAFSRAEKILVLTTAEDPKPHFRPIWQGLPQWPYVRQDLLKALRFRLRNRMPVKKSFSFTSDLKVYETCPRQYRFFRHFEFSPARSAEIFFGALVHQTIEDIHRWVLEGQALRLVEAAIPGLFDANFRHLVAAGVRPIGEAQRQQALAQVMNYFRQNKDQLRRVIETEVDVSVEKDDYILNGKIDLLLGDDQKLELLDFKSQPRPLEDDVRLRTYYLQLCVYAHILEQRYGKRPDRLLLYWTGEARREDALMAFPYDPNVIGEAGAHFDAVVRKILAKDFAIVRVPERRVCKECDFRLYCGSQGTIDIREEVAS